LQVLADHGTYAYATGKLRLRLWGAQSQCDAADQRARHGKSRRGAWLCAGAGPSSGDGRPRGSPRRSAARPVPSAARPCPRAAHAAAPGPVCPLPPACSPCCWGVSVGRLVLAQLDAEHVLIHCGLPPSRTRVPCGPAVARRLGQQRARAPRAARRAAPVSAAAAGAAAGDPSDREALVKGDVGDPAHAQSIAGPSTPAGQARLCTCIAGLGAATGDAIALCLQALC